MQRTDWFDLDDEVRAVVSERTGPVAAARTITDGMNSAVAIVLTTSAGLVFVKGLRVDHPGVVAQRREAAINPHVRDVSAELLWHLQVAGWDLLGFTYLDGRSADYTPGSADLPAVIDVARRIGELSCPDLPQLKRAEDRWSAYVDHPGDVALLIGDTLLHTDYNPLNVLLTTEEQTHVIDWAWPTRGAAFIDPGCLALRLVAAGHHPAEADTVLHALPAWRAAPVQAVLIFARVAARMWAEIAAADPQPWKQQMATAADSWLTVREHHSCSLPPGRSTGPPPSAR